LHQVGDLFELNVKLRCQKVKSNNIPEQEGNMFVNGLYYYMSCNVMNKTKSRIIDLSSSVYTRELSLSWLFELKKNIEEVYINNGTQPHTLEPSWNT